MVDIPKISWAPLYGEFEFNDNAIHFKGRTVTTPAGPQTGLTEPKDQPSFGLALTNQTLADGDISADVEFEDVTSESVCEIAVAYDANASHLVNAGLGGLDFALYTIREFGGPKTSPQAPWWNYRATGDRANLRAGVSYHLSVRFLGATVTLHVDGVALGTAEVTSPVRPRQVGIFCRGRHKVTVKNFSVQTGKPKAFVVMQFSNEFDDVFNDVVRVICEDYEVNVIRADEMIGPGLIISDIVREISESQLVIADITPTANPNVFFEVGYSLALNKPTILLARKGTSLPFDVAGFRVLFYENTIGGKSRLEEGLRRHLDAILSASQPTRAQP